MQFQKLHLTLLEHQYAMQIIHKCLTIISQFYKYKIWTLFSLWFFLSIPILVVSRTLESFHYIRVFIFYWVMGVYEDGSFDLPKHCQWKFMRERSEQFNPHRFLRLNFYLIRVMSEGALIIRFDDSVDYSSYMDCVHGYGCLMWRDFLVPLFFVTSLSFNTPLWIAFLHFKPCRLLISSFK